MRSAIVAWLFLVSQISAADPIGELKKWLEKDSKERSDIKGQSFYTTPLSKDQAQKASELLLKDFQDSIRKERAEEWKAKSITLDKLTMKFEYKVFGKKPKNGRSLFISMHGGGGAPARVNDQQWQNQIGLYKPAEGIYLAPRAPTNTWNLWHQGHIDRFFQRIIEDAIVFEDVDPNRVYIMGYSAGGDGVYQLAPRMADSLAAAAMMAGHPNDASPLGLRNIGFTLHMGGRDAAYNRNKVARAWKKKLAELQENDPDGYRHDVIIHEKYGHWMNRQDRVAVPWMAMFKRDPNPNKIVWRQASTTHGRFYWLAVDKEQRKNGSVVVANRHGQKIEISKMEGLSSINLRLNDDVVNLDQEVSVALPGKEAKKIKPVRTIRTLHDCLSERVDPSAIYCAQIALSLD